MAAKRRVVVSLNGAEFIELDVRAEGAGMNVPQYIRRLCGLPARGVIGAEVVADEERRARRPKTALERRSATILVDESEFAALDAGATAAGLSIPQYVRTRCGFEVRNSSLPGTEERDHEEEDAWDRLRRLGLDPQEYFPAEE